MNLRTIPFLVEKLGLSVGLSDHTDGIVAPVVAVTLGACIIEKHFTLSRSVRGPDSAFSLEPHEFRAMVDAVRETEKALGQRYLGISGEERASRVFRRSLFVVRDIKKGELRTSENIRSIRPGYGLQMRYLDKVLSLVASENLSAVTPLKWEHISPEK